MNVLDQSGLGLEDKKKKKMEMQKESCGFHHN